EFLEEKGLAPMTLPELDADFLAKWKIIHSSRDKLKTVLQRVHDDPRLATILKRTPRLDLNKDGSSFWGIYNRGPYELYAGFRFGVGSPHALMYVQRRLAGDQSLLVKTLSTELL